MLASIGETAELDRVLDSITLTNGLTPAAMEVLDRLSERAAPATKLNRLAFATAIPPQRLLEQVAAWPGRTHLAELVAIPQHRVGEAWYEADLLWLFAFDQLGIERIGIESGPYANRVVLTRVTGGIEVDIVANQEGLVVRMLSRKLPLPIKRLVVRGTPQVWFPPGRDFAKAIKKLPASAVELRERWASLGQLDRRTRK